MGLDPTIAREESRFDMWRLNKMDLHPVDEPALELVATCMHTKPHSFDLPHTPCDDTELVGLAALKFDLVVERELERDLRRLVVSTKDCDVRVAIMMRCLAVARLAAANPSGLKLT